jgi:N-acetylglutamate synthase-like GNAT family acetyltransferase
LSRRDKPISPENEMTNFSLRPARETESAQIKELIHSVGINPMDLDWKRFIVAVNDRDEMIGCGQIKPHGKDILELASLAVYPEHRGKGVARAMLKYLLKDSPRPLYLMCESSVGPLYEKFGFREFRTKRCRVIFNGSANWQGW